MTNSKLAYELRKEAAKTNSKILPAFHETPYGYESQVGDHRYVITFNGIAYDVTHYWALNPDGELIASGTVNPARVARTHYGNL